MFPEGNIKVEWKLNSLFPAGPVIKSFVMPPISKKERQMRRSRLLDAGWVTNLPRLQGDVRVESSSCCFPRELVGFVHPTRLSVSFDQRLMTRSPTVAKHM